MLCSFLTLRDGKVHRLVSKNILFLGIVILTHCIKEIRSYDYGYKTPYASNNVQFN